MGAVPRGASMDKDVNITQEKIVSKSLKVVKVDEGRGPFQPLSIQMETVV